MSGAATSDADTAARLHTLEPIRERMRNLKVDSSTEVIHSTMDSSKDKCSSDATSCISSAGDAAGSVEETDVDQKSLETEGGLPHFAGGYYGYYHPGYNCSSGEFNGQGYYIGSEGLDIQYPVMQADNGSFICLMPGLQPGCNAYSAYLPVMTIGIDGQYASQQVFPTSPMFQPISSPGYFLTLPNGELVQSSCLWDPSVVVNGAYGDSYSGIMDTPVSETNISQSSHTHVGLSKPVLPSDYGTTLQTKRSLPPIDVSVGQSRSKSSNKSVQHGSTCQSDTWTKGYFPIPKLPVCSQVDGRLRYQNDHVELHANPRGWVYTDGLKARSKVTRVSTFGSLHDKKHNLGTVDSKITLPPGDTAAGYLTTDENRRDDSITLPIKRDQYNLQEFLTNYNLAFFFVIKSYSEDDVHKSIKYSVWSSTTNGNKRLDSAYQEAQARTSEKGGKCPVFLFFSVNASGQFCGAAEMIGRVDFSKNMDFWQQDKWNGYFPVKWHIIKDVPNPLLRHIILENNDNKPVTNSRDTQEVKFPQGIEMLNIFKNYVSKTSILDDFDFYESRQKVMKERKMRQSLSLMYNRSCDLISPSIVLSNEESTEEPQAGDETKQ